MISVATFKWTKPGYRSVFAAENVNTSQRMVARNYPEAHEFLCVTDDPSGLDPGIKAIPLWGDHSQVPNPTWPQGPSCYRRLKVFSEWFEQHFQGDRLVVMDLDAVITGDLRPLWNRDEDFLMWRPNQAHIPTCASMFMLRRGAHRDIWDKFDAVMSPRLAGKAGFRGSDQAWITYCVGRDVPGWTVNDGVYGYEKPNRQALRRKRPNLHISARMRAQSRVKPQPPRIGSTLPPDARMVMFTGKPDPWDAEALAASPWIRDHYR